MADPLPCHHHSAFGREPEDAAGRSQVSSARKPMVAFADPVFSKAARARAQKQVAMRSITSFYRGTRIDLAALGEHLSQLPGTRREVKAIAAELNTDSGDVRLGLEATETAVKQAKLDQYRIVYFATHGLVSGELEPFTRSKAEPALALTIPDKPTDLTMGSSPQARSRSSSSMPTGWCCPPATRRQRTSRARKRCPALPAPSSMRVQDRSIVSHWKWPMRRRRG